MKTVGQFPHVVEETENTWIELADGCRLAARMWMPADAADNPVPAILEYLPYRKRDGTATRDALTHPYFAGHGYACIRVDMRGNGESDGLMEDEYLPQEQDDALEVIDWITAQPWCDGNVGMIGISWGGFNGLQVAARGPEALKAVISLASTDDRYADDIHFKGGCLLYRNLGWSATMFAFSSRPPDPVLVGERWRDMWIYRLQNEPLLVLNWLKHQQRDAFWKHGSVCEDFASIKAAVLSVCGWGDDYSNPVPRLLAGLQSPVRGIMGPWFHKYPHFAYPEPRIGFLQEALRWWDQFLKGEDRGCLDDPLYRAYLMESVRPQPYYAVRDGRWIAEDAWPSPRIEQRRFALNKGGLETEPGDAVPLDISSPEDLGANCGDFCPHDVDSQCPTDQRLEDALSLSFDSETLGERLEIFGAPVAELVLSADQPQANVVVRLCDVAPDGSSTRVSYGVLNLSHRDSHEFPEALEPGRTYSIRVQLDDIAYAFPAGHRIRVAISSTYWPMIWPSPRRTTLSVTAGASGFILPVRPAFDDDPRPFEEPEAAPPRSLRTIEEGGRTQIVERDMRTGHVTQRVDVDSGLELDTDTGLEYGIRETATHVIHPDDPLSAEAAHHYTVRISRDNWRIRTETFSAMTCDETHFHVSGRIEAYENDSLAFERDFAESIPRSFL
ncbi:MAG: CocE/NonD family hydrolase [Rhodospirillales bacterium]